MSESPAGWYPDPSGNTSKLRYWDGTQWTNDFSDSIPMQPVQSAQVAQSNQDQTLRLVAFIFCVVSLVSVCWLIIPLAWMIPMTIYAYGIYKGTKPNTVAFGVCTLLFISIVAGVLLLIADKQD